MISNAADRSRRAGIEPYLLFKFESRSLVILVIAFSVDFPGKCTFDFGKSA